MATSLPPAWSEHYDPRYNIRFYICNSQGFLPYATTVRPIQYQDYPVQSAGGSLSGNQHTSIISRSQVASVSDAVSQRKSPPNEDRDPLPRDPSLLMLVGSSTTESSSVADVDVPEASSKPFASTLASPNLSLKGRPSEGAASSTFDRTSSYNNPVSRHSASPVPDGIISSGADSPETSHSSPSPSISHERSYSAYQSEVARGKRPERSTLSRPLSRESQDNNSQDHASITSSMYASSNSQDSCDYSPLPSEKSMAESDEQIAHSESLEEGLEELGARTPSLSSAEQLEAPMHWDHCRTEEAELAAKSVFICGICFEEQPEEDISLFDGCDHPFCLRCIMFYIISEVKENRFAIYCPSCTPNQSGSTEAPIDWDHEKSTSSEDWRSEESEPAAKSVFICGICFEEHPEEDIAHFNGCEHPFCRGCIMSYIISEVKENRFTIYCPSCTLNQSAEDDPRSDHEKSTSAEDCRSEESEPAPIPVFVCGICLDEQPEEDVSRINGCEHPFCRECIRSHIISKIKENRYPIYCPSCTANHSAEDDPSAVGLEVVLQVGIPDRYFLIFEQLQLSAFSILWHCPKCKESMFVDKQEYLEQDAFFCPMPSCHGHSCKHCGREIPFAARHSCDGSSKLDSLMKKKGWKYCPGCSSPIQKESGCNHITCLSPGCNTHFCYLCGEEIVRSSLMREIEESVQAHYRKCTLFDI